MAVPLLAAGSTYAEAAAAAGVSERTIKRRMTDGRFRNDVAAVRADMVRRTSGALTDASVMAVGTLIALLDVAVPPSTRLGAAKAILDAEATYREAGALEERLQLLEGQLEGQAVMAS